MASSAFKSTTRRTLHASDDRKPPPSRRSRSVTAAPRRVGGDLEEYANTRTNPLFDCASLSSPPPPPAGCGGGELARRERGREVKGGGRGGGGGRARSASVAPPRRCSTSSTPMEIGGDERSASRARSVAGETNHENGDEIRNLQSWRNRHPTSSTSEASSGGKHWGDGVFTSSSSEVSMMKRHREINGNIHSESSSAFSEIEDDLEHAIWRNNHSTIPVKQVLEIPPEFDIDAAEFVSGISEYSTKLKQDQIVEIPREFDPDASELVSDIRQHATKFLQEEIKFPLELDPDAAELVYDIREYTTKLKQSHERAQKLRTDLAVEEQREQELSRLLKNIVTTPNFAETHKKRPRRKQSIERLKVSRCLAEEAMNYFEECVSISTLDSTDFSSFEDPQPNSVVSVQPMSNSRVSQKEDSTFPEHHLPTDRLGHHEGLDNQTQCSISITRSDVSDSVFFGRTKVPDFIIGHNSSDDLDGFDTPCSVNSHFSFAHDGRQYLRSSGKGISKEPREIRSSYCDDEYVFLNVSENLLTDMVTFRNRIESGGLLVCNIRTF